MKIKDLIWYEIGLAVGTALIAGASLVRRLTARRTGYHVAGAPDIQRR
jgi:hypothetical protein